MNEKFFDFINSCPSAYHTVSTLKCELENAGFIEIFENRRERLTPGKSYFVTRNGSSLIAFKLPKKVFNGFMIAASHSDSPSFEIKEPAELHSDGYVKLSTEKYGGMLCSTWLDKPLSVAGRVAVSTDEGVRVRLVDSKAPIAVIPNVAIHMNRSANENASFNAAVDMQALFSANGEAYSFGKMLSELSSADEKNILSYDLYLYNPQSCVQINDLICAPRLDDLQCVFASKEAFISTESNSNVSVLAVFDNEEVGSRTKQGAASTFLHETLVKISAAYGMSDEDYFAAVANSFMLSCDNAHAIHPNHPEYADPVHRCRLNGGVVIKYNANRHYTSDGISAAVFKKIAENAGVPTQNYYNRADILGGSTLGNISNAVVSLNTVDIGIAQLSMHSSYETAGALDTEYMVKAISGFYSTKLDFSEDTIKIL